ncbi:Ectonucleoside triphosphate diphosphohydrolase 1 [Portunus trituberculatus]|uniref:Ectonucleoside triphosphate diphosphohydrolase 1 n=1 Tax=Portunus trituberculatus TaxID=210409 RepID=A0A5B7FKR9_PORTR|nr:Ectonucleoside triphosphate diphosphohydrolase 1 [Portunus trituberculatus]
MIRVRARHYPSLYLPYLPTYLEAGRPSLPRLSQGSSCLPFKRSDRVTDLVNQGASVSDKYVMRSRDNHILNLNKTLQQANIENGDTLMIGLLGDEKQTFSFGSWYLVTFASFIIGFFGIGCVMWLCLQVLPRPQKFGVVIDAGSSHSEVFVFSWDGEKPLGTAEVKLVHRCFINGGINSFASHVEDLPNYFDPCLSEAEGYVPAAKQPDTPIYLGATAGMRILR